MPITLYILMLITDIGFILYWSLSALMLIGVEIVPPEQMFKDYENHLLQVWNWSFAPLDIVLSIVGLAAVKRAAKGEKWQGLAIVSLTLTSTAGLMALSFWAIKGDFDVMWWGMNGFLMVWPLFFLPKMVNASS